VERLNVSASVAYFFTTVEITEYHFATYISTAVLLRKFFGQRGNFRGLRRVNFDLNSMRLLFPFDSSI
jgi:hypothetical protein